jgi:hypothetical protein
MFRSFLEQQECFFFKILKALYSRIDLPFKTLIYIKLSRGLGSCLRQSIWNFWWTKWHYDRSFSEFFGFPVSISFCRGSPHSYVIWGWTISPLVGTVQRHSLTPVTWRKNNNKHKHGSINDKMAILKILHKRTSMDIQEKFHIYKPVKFICVLNEQHTVKTNVLFNLTIEN